MFSKCRIALLGLVVVHGASLMPMESTKGKELSNSGNQTSSLRNSGKTSVVAAITTLTVNKDLLSCSAELQREKNFPRNFSGCQKSTFTTSGGYTHPPTTGYYFPGEFPGYK